MREQAKEYWNDLANRLNELAKEMEEEHMKELMRRKTKLKWRCES